MAGNWSVINFLDFVYHLIPDFDLNQRPGLLFWYEVLRKLGKYVLNITNFIYDLIFNKFT